MAKKYTDEQKTAMVNKVNELRKAKSQGGRGLTLEQAIKEVKGSAEFSWAGRSLYTWWQAVMLEKAYLPKVKKKLGEPVPKRSTVADSKREADVIKHIQVALGADVQENEGETVGPPEELEMMALRLIDKILSRRKGA